MQRIENLCVMRFMICIRAPLLLSAALLCGCAAPAAMPLVMAGGAPSFAQFGEDENFCRQVGAAAAQVAPGTQADEAAAAHRYDDSYQRCMFEHGRSRMMAHMAGRDPSDDPTHANVHSFEYPDAFYSVPYGTPGYGYDGFSYR